MIFPKGRRNLRSQVTLALVIACCLVRNARTAKDNFDQIWDKMASVTPDNCASKHKLDLQLDQFVVPRVRGYNDKTTPINMGLQQIGNMAVNRASFYSFIYQYLNNFHNFLDQPGLMYYYRSAAADLFSGGTTVTGSAVVLDNNMFYANFLKTLPFNRTIPLFGPMAWFSNSDSTNSRVDVQDLGAKPGMNYTKPWYPTGPWYEQYLPDHELNGRPKITYHLRLNTTGKSEVFSFFIGWVDRLCTSCPPSKVAYTQPFYDCGRSNNWILSAVSPVADYIPRYTLWTHLRRARYVGEAVVSMKLENIDINQCPLSASNPPPNKFAGTDKCSNTTMCEPMDGYGFRRGGYKCVCKPGYQYPDDRSGPYMGMDIENATIDQYNNGFQCMEIPRESVEPTRMEQIVSREDFLGRIESSLNLTNYAKAESLLSEKRAVSADNCSTKQEDTLILSTDAGIGASEQFNTQGRVALRLAHFLSNFLQNSNTGAELWHITADTPVNEYQMFGEVFSSVVADPNIYSCGVFEKGSNFAPFAYRVLVDSTGSGENMDWLKITNLAGWEMKYTNQSWFVNMKDGSKRYTMHSLVRSDNNGSNLVDGGLQHYYAAEYSDGVWLPPTFKCDGLMNDWVLTYVAPYFGTQRQFVGVVTVDVPLDRLDINQCPSLPRQAPSAFSNSALCDEETTVCVPLPGKGFQLGGYICQCKSGFQFPFQNGSQYFDGRLMEDEYTKYRAGADNRFGSLKCQQIREYDTTERTDTSGGQYSGAIGGIIIGVIVGFTLIARVFAYFCYTCNLRRSASSQRFLPESAHSNRE